MDHSVRSTIIVLDLVQKKNTAKKFPSTGIEPSTLSVVLTSSVYSLMFANCDTLMILV